MRSTEAFTAKCRNPGMNPQKFGKTSWREILFEACDIIDRQAEEFKALREKRDPVKYPWQIHLCKATKEEYIRALKPLLPHELVAQLKAKDQETIKALVKTCEGIELQVPRLI